METGEPRGVASAAGSGAAHDCRPCAGVGPDAAGRCGTLRDARLARTSAQLGWAERGLFQWGADYPEDADRELDIIEALESVLTRREAPATRSEPVFVGRAA